LSAVPIKAEPFDKSEMTSQLLFGDLYEVNAEVNNWKQITCNYDGYTGWIDERQHGSINVNQYEKIASKPQAYTLEIVYPASSSEHHLPLLIGSTLHHFDGMNFKHNGEKFVYQGQAIDPSKVSFTPDLIEKLCTRYLNAPYMWGGKSPFGIDCSGFTQMIMKMIGIKLKRDAYQQAMQGRNVNLVSEAQTGDLAFFDNAEGKIVHTGIIIDQSRIIHACGKVRSDKLDHFGIFNQQTNKYSHKLRLIKRVIA